MFSLANKQDQGAQPIYTTAYQLKAICLLKQPKILSVLNRRKCYILNELLSHLILYNMELEEILENPS